MELNVIAYLSLLTAVALLRLAEVRISKRHQQELYGRGASRVSEPKFRWMVLLHAGVLIGAASEVTYFRRPFLPLLAVPMFLIFLAANGVRWWVIRTMGEHWNVQIMNSTGLGVVTTGPFQFVRHPNYCAVFVEMLALPLIHTAWITAILGTVAHTFVLARRIEAEEKVLLTSSEYRVAMGRKPRFIPGLF
jgi:methyltransferase